MREHVLLKIGQIENEMMEMDAQPAAAVGAPLQVAAMRDFQQARIRMLQAYGGMPNRELVHAYRRTMTAWADQPSLPARMELDIIRYVLAVGSLEEAMILIEQATPPSRNGGLRDHVSLGDALSVTVNEAPDAT